ncbi:MAG: hypothetical protein HY586_01140 [Candidatus Omnitrophica bacterium]|nr:hypothetical protein [Candidatus Omnitrophota bacterium]
MKTRSINKKGKIRVHSKYIVSVKEIPTEEAWLYKNKKALASVLRGIKQAEQGLIRKLDLKELAQE